MQTFPSDRKSWLSILQHLSLTHAWRSLDRLEWNVPSWSISTETLAYLCFPLLMLMVHRQKVIAITALSFAAAAIYAHTFVNYRDIGEQQPLLRCLAGFVAGILLHQLWQRYRDRLSMVISTMQIAAAVLAAVALHLNWSQSIIIAALACLILATAEGTGPLSRLLSKSPLMLLGTLSYSLYMTHWIFYRLYWMYGDHLFSGLASLYSPVNVYALKVMVLTSLSLGLAFLTYHWIELPARSALKYRFAKK